MSTPQSLVLPEGVSPTTLESDRGPFAAHVIRVPDPLAHVLLGPGCTGSKEEFTPRLRFLACIGLQATA